MMMMIKNLVAKVALDKPKWLLLVEIPWVSPLKEKQLQHYRWQKPDISWYMLGGYMVLKLIYFVRSKGDIYYNWYVLFCPSSPPSDRLCRTWPPSLLASSLPGSLLFFIGIFKVIFIIVRLLFIAIFKITTIAIVFTTCPHGGGKQPCKRPCSSAGQSQTGDSSFIFEYLKFCLI